MENYTGEIRQIQYGVFPAPAPCYKIIVGKLVGGKNNPLMVIEILQEPLWEGKFEYHILCSKVDDKGNAVGEIFCWKTYKLQPDEIQYFIPDEKHDYIKI